MLRTPPRCTPEDAVQSPQHPPKGKLASVTRKMNEIEGLLTVDSPDFVDIRKNFTEYLVRVERLLQACDDSDDAWLESNKTVIDQFRIRVEEFLKLEPQRSRNSGSALASQKSGSVRSRSSKCSTASSTRIRLAERKARLDAEREHLINIQKIEQRELELKHERSKVELAREDLETKLLEQAFNEMDDHSKIASKVSRIKPPTEHRPPTVDATPLQQFLTQQNEISKSILGQRDQASLPKKTLEPFDGVDITKFKIFLHKFELLIESKCKTELEKLTYLEQFTRGQALKLVQSCTTCDPALGYARAKELLISEYGNDFKIANAYLETLSNWPDIESEDKDALLDISTFLVQAKHFLENGPLGSQLNNPKEIMNVVMKLPFKIRERWRVQTLEISKTLQRNVYFDDLVEFVRNEASLVRQPLFGTIVDTAKRKGKVEPYIKSKARVTTSISTTSGNDAKYCELCKKDNHDLSYCIVFKKKSFTDKSDFVRKSGLCFGCLSRGHVSKSCKKPLSCATCQRRHPTIMHNETSASKPGSQSTLTGNGGTGSVQQSRSNLKASSVCETGKLAQRAVSCPIVAARISSRSSSKEMVINVALDPHSSDCWLREDIAKELNMKLLPRSVTLTTMKDKTIMDSNLICGLLVEDVNRMKKTEIPLLFTRHQDSWPFTKDDVPSSADVSPYPYLANVPFDFVDADVGLLIGMNMPGLLKPTSIVDGSWSEPFALCYWLGWTFNGPIARKKKISSCHRLKNKTIEDELEAFFTRDFAGTSIQTSPSVEDNLWLDKVTKSLKSLPGGHYEIGLPFRDEEVKFPSNRGQALSRFFSLKKKFAKNEQFFKDYSAFMQEMIDKTSWSSCLSGRACSRKSGSLCTMPFITTTNPKSELCLTVLSSFREFL